MPVTYLYADVGARLTAVREGFSDDNRTEFAKRHGFPQSRYNNWENGYRRIPVEHAEKLCEAYGLSLDFIYRGRLDGLSENARKVL